jgi:hypothetical protein
MIHVGTSVDERLYNQVSVQRRRMDESCEPTFRLVVDGGSMHFSIEQKLHGKARSAVVVL